MGREILRTAEIRPLPRSAGSCAVRLEVRGSYQLHDRKFDFHAAVEVQISGRREGRDLSGWVEIVVTRMHAREGAHGAWVVCYAVAIASAEQIEATHDTLRTIRGSNHFDPKSHRHIVDRPRVPANPDPRESLQTQIIERRAKATAATVRLFAAE